MFHCRENHSRKESPRNLLTSKKPYSNTLSLIKFMARHLQIKIMEDIAICLMTVKEGVSSR